MFNLTDGEAFLLWCFYIGLPLLACGTVGFLLGAWIF